MSGVLPAEATQIFKFIPSDIGRPLADIVHKLDYLDLQDDAQNVLRTLAFSEKQITSKDGSWYIVRIMPYRTLENVIDGVSITFIDISEAKRLEARLQGRRVNRRATPEYQGSGMTPPTTPSELRRRAEDPAQCHAGRQAGGHAACRPDTAIA